MEVFEFVQTFAFKAKSSGLTVKEIDQQFLVGVAQIS
jgi:hypothetical protein